MAYVDLNPVRAGMANTPETSDYTSIKSRAERAKTAADPDSRTQQPTCLLPFVRNAKEQELAGIPMPLTDYLTLVDGTGRLLRADKPGA
ncbi:transposase, partial [Gilvimarinus sp. 1_MG-2023]|nr:transposase [Gilvimarinus sp. 1_MG-2023]